MGADLGLAIIATSADKTEENSVWTGSTHTEKAGLAFGSFWTECCWEFGEAIWCRGEGAGIKKEGIERTIEFFQGLLVCSFLLLALRQHHHSGFSEKLFSSRSSKMNC